MVKKPVTERIADSWRNLMLRAGIGAGSADDGGHYAINYTSRDRAQLDAAYRSNWMAMKMVSLPAADMTREGVELGGGYPVAGHKAVGMGCLSVAGFAAVDHQYIA